MPEDDPGDPGGGGDPYVVTLGKKAFFFEGEHGRRYTFLRYERPDGARLEILPRIAMVPDVGNGSEIDGKTLISGVDVHAGPVHLYLGPDAKAHIFYDGNHLVLELKACTLDKPGHYGCTSEEPHPLQGVTHLNLTMPQHDDIPADAVGLMIDGDEDADPKRYEVPG